MPAVTISDPQYASNGVGSYAQVLPKSPGEADTSGSDGSLAVARRGKRLFNSGTVPGGAAFDSGILDASMFESLTIVAVNSSGVTTRTVTITFFDSDGVTTLHTITRTLAVSATEKYGIGTHAVAAGTLELLTVAAPLDVGPMMRVQVAAAGADAVAIRGWGH